MSKQDTIISLLREINESVDDWDTTFVTTDLAITENGLYKPIDYNVEGFNTVDVNVSPTLEEITITENGEYIPSEGVDGFSKVVVEAGGSSNKVVLSSLRVSNNDIIDGYWAAELVDISNLSNLNSTFYSCTNLQTLDISSWNTSNITSMISTFYDCKSIEYLNIKDLDVSNVTNMTSLFSNCLKLLSLDLSNWNVSNVTNMLETFHNCWGLSSLVVSNWDVSSVTEMGRTFSSCRKLKQLDISEWDVSNVTDMNSMFNGSYTLESLDLSNWNVSNVTNVWGMFYQCESLTSIIGNRTIEDVLVNNICALNGLKVSANMFNKTNNLDRASLRALINGLADLTGQTAQTLSIGRTLLAKLTEEDIAIATAKNWTIS